MKRLVLALGALAVALLVAEVLARTVWRDATDPARLAAQAEAHRMGALKRFSHDERLVFELIPGLDTRFGGGRVVTDADGVRVPPDGSAQVADDAFRLAVVGDSTCFGWKVAYEESYPALVRGALERAWDRPVALRNFCVPGYNAGQELAVLETRVLPWRPDLLLWHYDHGDSLPAVGAGAAGGMPADYGRNPLGSAFLKLLARRLRAARTAWAPVDRDAHRVWNDFIVSGPLYEAHLDSLRAAADRCRAAGLPALLVLFDPAVEPPPGGREHVEVLHRDLVPALEVAGWDVLDLHPLLERVLVDNGWPDLSHLWVSTEPLDAHPNPDGHRLIAGLVLEALLRRWPAPP